jgi:hypothetical protein
MTSLIMLWQRKLVVILQNHECQHNDIKENFNVRMKYGVDFEGSQKTKQNLRSGGCDTMKLCACFQVALLHSCVLKL